jgi:hypothetical protein
MLLHLALAAAIASAAAPTKFDLKCEGPIRDTPPTYQFRYVIDLDTGTYCKVDGSGPCRGADNIAEVSKGSIILQNVQAPGISVVESIDRVAATALMLSRIRGNYETQSGRCTVAPFSGFPATKF